MMASSPLRMLRIEVDGHFHGGEPPRPWVARILGPCPKYGLAREFVRPLNDWKDARRAWSGNLYGVVATFPLRDGAMYEVSRLRGTSSNRHVAREFCWMEAGERLKRSPDEALEWAERDDRPAIVLSIRESEDPPWVAEVRGLGTPRRLGFVLVDGQRRYRLHEECLYEVRESESAIGFVAVIGGEQTTMSSQEAIAWLERK